MASTSIASLSKSSRRKDPFFKSPPCLLLTSLLTNSQMAALSLMYVVFVSFGTKRKNSFTCIGAHVNTIVTRNSSVIGWLVKPSYRAQ